jgi:hypothetical protein
MMQVQTIKQIISTIQPEHRSAVVLAYQNSVAFGTAFETELATQALDDETLPVDEIINAALFLETDAVAVK